MRHERTRQLSAGFAEVYGRQPAFAVRAPGRVNLIGEHTDYNEGFCLPMAIDRDVQIAVAPVTAGRIRARSCEADGEALIRLGEPLAPDAATPWADYLRGCIQVLQQAGEELVGCDLLLTGDVPLGSGLSSSAALEVATMHALLRAAGRPRPGTAIARWAQRAENDFVGTHCGILDQLASSCAEAGRAMLMDCRDCSLQPVPLPAGGRIVIADTGKRRGLVDSAYNQRRAQCEAGAAAVGVAYLRDATLHQLQAAAADGRLDADSLARCQHVVAENGRTLAAAACLRAGDAAALGQLMDQSHDDLRQRFGVTCAELDAMTGIARSLPGCLGSRMTGAGFGGCTVSLVVESAVPAFTESLLARYNQDWDLPAAVYVTGAAAGAGDVDLEDTGDG